MGKKIQPTSREAFESLDPDKIRLMYKKIVSALETLGTGTYEDISLFLNEQPVRIWKRMSELNRLGLAHRTGERKVMASGRSGFIWAAGKGEQQRIHKERVMKGPSVGQFAKAILNQPKQSNHTIERLF